MINIGDKVTVVNRGNLYSTYKSWVKNNAPQYLSKWKCGESPAQCEGYTILAKGKHEDGYDMLYLIQDDQSNQVYIIGERGIKEDKAMEFKVGDKVEVINNAGDRRLSIGDLCTVTKEYNGMLWITRDSDGYHSNMYSYRFKVVDEYPLTLKEALKILIDGSEVIDNQGYILKFDMDTAKFYSKKSPSDDYVTVDGFGDNEDSYRFKEYIPEPRFKRGQTVVRGNGFFRISKVNSDLTYVITGLQSCYKDGKGLLVSEDELKEAE